MRLRFQARRVAPAAFLVAALAAAACGAPPTFVEGMIACTVDRECPPAFRCFSNACRSHPVDAGESADRDAGGDGDGGCTDTSAPRCMASDTLRIERCVGGRWQPASEACVFACLNGGCVSCSPRGARCTADNLPQLCNTNGDWEDQAPCPVDRPVCNDVTGYCDIGCQERDKRCKPNAPVIQQCDAQGIWRDSTTCAYVCNGNGAATACS